MNKDAILARNVPDLTAEFSQQTLNLRGGYKSRVNKTWCEFGNASFRSYNREGRMTLPTESQLTAVH